LAKRTGCATPAFLHHWRASAMDLKQFCIWKQTVVVFKNPLLPIVRLLLEYTGTKYEDKKLACGPAPTFDRSAWTDQKFSLGLDFPNLPYYIDEEVRLERLETVREILVWDWTSQPDPATSMRR
jgi:hypothetical protein